MTVSTYATQGTFTTPYFKQDFDLNKFSLISDYKLTIWIPDSVYKSKTIDLVLEIDYDLMERHGSQSFEIVSISSSRVEKLETFNKKIVKKISPDRRSVFVEFTRSLSKLDIENWKPRRITGMSVSWHYSSPSAQSEYKHRNKDGNRYYRNLLSLVLQHQAEDQLWKAAKFAKMEKDLMFCFGSLFTTSFDGETSQLLKSTLDYLEIKNISIQEEVPSDIPDEALDLAAKIYIYLDNCPADHWYNWNVWLEFYTDLFNNFSIRNALLTLSRISTSSKSKGRMEFELSKRLFRKLSNSINLPGGSGGSGVSGVNNHPVHILDPEGKMSPSAFIPFCYFGKKVKNRNNFSRFREPVCSIFQQRIFKDQVCYEVDLKKEEKTSENMHLGLGFLYDNNEERFVGDLQEERGGGEELGFMNNFVTFEETEKTLVYINSLGMKNESYKNDI